jgi:diaminopimelate epimerase
MAKISFDKYQGTGNDFVMIDNRDGLINPADTELIFLLCHRKFGIGSDGVILIQKHESYDFEMVYLNPDGTQSLCGNGSRCAVIFSRELGIIRNTTTFLTIEGPLRAKIRSELVYLSMPDVKEVIRYQEDYYLDTGSPHYVRFVPNVKDLDVYQTGREIRFSPRFQPAGTNVNFVQKVGSSEIYVRTYERGVEQETLSCGTGVTASALVHGLHENQRQVDIKTNGGNLKVSFELDKRGGFTGIQLIGPAEKVFSGQMDMTGKP